MRVIRYEEGKEAEIFTLVMKGTNEEAWYSTSTSDKSYIELTEDQLDNILEGNEMNYPVQIAEEVDVLFRL